MKNFNAIAICLTGLAVYQFSKNTVFNTTTKEQKKTIFLHFYTIHFFESVLQYSHAVTSFNDRNYVLQYKNISKGDRVIRYHYKFN